MPARQLPLVNGEIYHILNRGVAHSPVFVNRYDYKRFINSIKLYQFQSPPVNCSRFINLTENEKEKNLKNLTKQVEILSYCLMPNHFHLILKQKEENGIAEFMRYSANSYGKYFNEKHNRKGPLFEGRFRAVRVESEEQLLHLGRYIHLNPYSAFLVKKIEDLFDYPYSSMREHLGLSDERLCQKEIIMKAFGGSIKKYKNFIVDQADYQQRLQFIKHQTLE